MRLPLPFVRRKPPPRHALRDEAPLAPAPKRRDGSTIGVILVLVLTSGFVAGTTATFTGTTTNAGNEFAGAALAVPPNLTAQPSGNNVQLNWTDAIGVDSAGAGYRINWADWQAMPNGGGTGTCGLTDPISWTKAGVAQGGGVGLLDTGVSARANFTDGRVVCYQAQTSYPCCPGGVEGTNPWLSQKSGTNSNPTKAVVVGMTLLDFATGNVTTPGTVATGDWFDFTFNQAIDMTSTATITSSQFLCMDTVSATKDIWIGMSGNGAACPNSGGTAAQNDTTFRGFKLVKTAGTGVGGTGATRYPIVVTTQTCTALPGCFKFRVTVQNPSQGAVRTLSGTYKVEPSNNLSYIKSATGAVKICGKSTSTTTTSTPSAILGTFSADPTNGKCIYTGYSFLGKI